MADLTRALETTTDAAELTSNKTSADVSLEYILWVVVLPVVMPVGIVGNILAFIVLQSKQFRHSTTGVYLTLTAIADTLFLLTGGLEILEVAGLFSVREYNVWTCRAYKFLFYTSGDASVWLVVAFTFDRFVAVCFPLSKRRVCRWKRAVIASVTIVLLSLAKNLHEFWTRGPEYRANGQLRRICGTQAQYYFFLDYVRPWIALILVMAIPFILLLIFNCMIVHSLIKAQRLRNKTAATATCATPSDTGTGNKPLTSSPGFRQTPNGAVSTSSTRFRQTTLMCLSISFAFLILVTPSIVLLIGKPYWKHRTNAAYKNAKAIGNFLSFLNHCINFFLYCVAGRRFRHELKAMFTCRRVEVPPSPTT